MDIFDALRILMVGKGTVRLLASELFPLEHGLEFKLSDGELDGLTSRYTRDQSWGGYYNIVTLIAYGEGEVFGLSKSGGQTAEKVTSGRQVVILSSRRSWLRAMALKNTVNQPLDVFDALRVLLRHSRTVRSKDGRYFSANTGLRTIESSWFCSDRERPYRRLSYNYLTFLDVNRQEMFRRA